MKPDECFVGQRVRHRESGAVYTLASNPSPFDALPAVIVKDAKGHASMFYLSGLDAADKNEEVSPNE